MPIFFLKWQVGFSTLIRTVFARLIWVEFALLGCVLIHPSPCWSDEPDGGKILIEIEDDLAFLKEETVSIASRYEQPISEAPGNVYVISEEDIRQSGATDLPTILRRIPGMEVMQTTAADFNVSIRGDNQLVSNKLLVMVNGRSIYVDVQGTVFWKLLPVTIAEIRRIEVLKGPSSAVYGFNAFDGVINIITKKPKELKRVQGQFAGGEFGTLQGSAILSQPLGPVDVSLSVAMDQQNQWRDRNALGFRAYTFHGQVEHEITPTTNILLSGGIVDANRFDGLIAGAQAQSNEPAQSFANLSFKSQALSIQGWWSRFSTKTQNSVFPTLAPFVATTTLSGSPKLNFESNTYNVDGQYTYSYGTGNNFNLGVNYRHNTLSSNIVREFTTENRFGLFLHHLWQITTATSLWSAPRNLSSGYVRFSSTGGGPA
ncbi:MAG: TonB-dependent receptor plug domain-containing protein [Nitrospirota bacterium]|nr:TonB-dependent receptor plug domain-containing protein [Nitrospirota bacterium]